MSESPPVVIAISSQTNIIKPQTYTNLSTIYNQSELLSAKSESDFYNSVITTSSQDSNSIYGFLSANTNLSYEDSIIRIVDFFQHKEHINIIICDVMSKHSGFSSYEHIHPGFIHKNIPFFIRGSILKRLKFSDENNMLQQALTQLTQMDQIVFHIAEPLITRLHEGSA